MNRNLGLHRVSSDELKRLLRALHRGVLPSPITRSALIEKTFGHIEGHLDALVGRDLETAKAVIAAVLGERGAVGAEGARLSYMGVPVAGTCSRDLLEQVRELATSATRSLSLYGVRLDEDERLFRTLVGVVDGRDVRLRLLFDPQGTEAAEAAVRDLCARWFRDPSRLEVFVATAARVRMRALVVDEARMLITSGALSATEDDGSLDLGVSFEAPGLVEVWHQEWSRLLAAGAVAEILGAGELKTDLR